MFRIGIALFFSFYFFFFFGGGGGVRLKGSHRETHSGGSCGDFSNELDQRFKRMTKRIPGASLGAFQLPHLPDPSSIYQLAQAPDLSLWRKMALEGWLKVMTHLS